MLAAKMNPASRAAGRARERFCLATETGSEDTQALDRLQAATLKRRHGLNHAAALVASLVWEPRP
jgi:hypothetical protein